MKNAHVIKQKTVVAQVMEALRQLIASGKYNAGDKIPTEAQLAEQFGIGRSSIREAIKIFNYLGVLESKAAKGTFLCDESNISSEALSWGVLLGNREMTNLIDFRGAIELWSVVNLTTKVAAKEDAALDTIKTLYTCVEGLRESHKKEARDVMAEYDYKFHIAIIESYGNPVFLTAFTTLRSFLYEEIWKSQETYKETAKIWREHEEITKGIESGDVKRAMSVFTDHISNIQSRVSTRGES